MALQDTDTDMYADDSTLIAQAKTTPELEEKLSSDATKVSTWFQENRMAANTTKTKIMFYTTWKKRASLPENERKLKAKLNGKDLVNVESEKLLGVVVNHILSWESHINGLVSNINRKLALLRRIIGCLPLPTRKLFSNSHILPYINYCSIVWADSRGIFKAQKRIARTILDVKGKAIRDPENRSHLLFSKLNWMNIFNQVKFRKATKVYKCLNNLCTMCNYVRNSHKILDRVHRKTWKCHKAHIRYCLKTASDIA